MKNKIATSFVFLITLFVGVPSVLTATPSPPVISSPGSGSAPGTTISTTTPTMSWSGVSGATQYTLSVSIAPYGPSNIVYQNLSVSGGLTSLDIPAGFLFDGGQYRWNMTAKNSSGESGNSNTLYFVVSTSTGSPPSPPVISSPGSGSAPGTTISTATPTMSWSGVSGATQYTLSVSSAPYGPSNIVYQNLSVSGGLTSLDIPAGFLANGGQYRWNMTAKNSSGESANSNTLYFAVSTSTGSPPSPPVISSPGSGSAPGTTISTATPTMSWSGVSGATQYTLSVSSAPYGPSNIVYQNLSVSGGLTSLDIPAGFLANGGQYRWNMTAKNSSGESADSNTLYFVVSTSTGKPGAFTLAANPYCNPSTPAISLSWSPANGASSYQLFRDETPYGQPLPANNLTFDNTASVVAGQRYSYFVTASNGDGTTDSNTVPISVPLDICSATTAPGAFVLSASPICTPTSPVVSAIVLTWTPATNATSFDVFRDGSLLRRAAPGTSYEDASNIGAGNSYSYFIRAIDGAGERDSNIVPVVFPSAGCASPSNPLFSISGRIRDPQNNPIPNLVLKLSGDVQATATSDDEGIYSFSGLPSGGYQLTLSSPGYAYSQGLSSVEVISITLGSQNATVADIIATTINPPSLSGATYLRDTGTAFLYESGFSTSLAELVTNALLSAGGVPTSGYDATFTSLIEVVCALQPEACLTVTAAYELASTAQLIYDTIESTTNPLHIAPLASSLSFDNGVCSAPPTNGSPLPVTAIVGLDYIEVPPPPNTHNTTPLTLTLSSCDIFGLSPSPPIDTITLMTAEELDQLNPFLVYFLIPKRPFYAPNPCTLGTPCFGDPCYVLTANQSWHTQSASIRLPEPPELLKQGALSFDPASPLLVPITPQAESTKVNVTVDFGATKSSSDSSVLTAAPASILDAQLGACTLNASALDSSGVALAVASAPAEGRQSLDLGYLPPDGWQLQFASSCPGTATASLQMLHGEHVLPGVCSAGDRNLCLTGSRFTVEASWRDAAGKRSGVAHAIPRTDESGTLWFFDAKNVELIVKVLDGTSLNGHFWVFYGALSDVEYWIRVTDQETGQVRTYYNPRGNLCGRGDTSAFPTDETNTSSGSQAVHVEGISSRPREGEVASRKGAVGPCQGGTSSLCLLGGRFEVAVSWRTNSGTAGQGVAISSTDESGFFWFFDSRNIELAVKILDGTTVNGEFWVFYGALSDVDYSVNVRDTLTGTTKSYHNASGNICGSADTSAFAGNTLGPAPSISAVSPNPVPGSNAAQTFTIMGNNFASGATVTLRDLSAGQIFTGLAPASLSGNQIIINANFTTAAHTWSVEVVNPDGQSSGQFQLQVQGSDTDTVSLNVTDGCSDGLGLRVRFFDKTYGGVFPNAQTYYTVASDGTSSFTFDAKHGARLCLGAETDPPNGLSWCYGINGDQDGSYSSLCCMDMPASGPLSWEMTLGCN
jgi:uncharacterized protein YegP (UPF0339 family)